MKKFLLFLLVLVFFSGCSGNLLKGIDSKDSGTAQKVSDAQSALDQGDYQKVIDSLKDEVSVTTPTASGYNAQAQVIYAQAELGKAGFDAPSLLNSAIDKISSSSTQSQDFSTIYSLLPSIDLTTLTDATSRLNNANPTVSGEQLTAGIANALDAVLTVYDKFDTNKDGKLTTDDTALQDPAAAANTWKGIENKVLNNAEKSVDFINSSLSGSSETTTDLKKAVSDVQTQLKTISGDNTTAILNALLNLDGAN